jgi:hypothetical protein
MNIISLITPIVLIIILLGFSNFPGNVFSQLDEAGMSETIKNCNFAATQVASDQSLTQEVKDAAEQFLTSCDGFISTTKNFCQSDPSPSFCTGSGLDDYLALRPSQ